MSHREEVTYCPRCENKEFRNAKIDEWPFDTYICSACGYALLPATNQMNQAFEEISQRKEENNKK
jgi:transposase-like protein